MKNNWKEIYKDIHNKAYTISMVKPIPSEWIEKNIILPEGVSRYKGKFSYDLSPYAREVVDTLASDHPARAVAVMKAAQIGFTQGLIVPGMAYIISEDAAPMMFMAADKELAKKSIEERLDPILHSSGLQSLIRPSVLRAKNQRTGDTSTSKEYAGGRLTIEGTNNADKMRQISVKVIFADDFEAAPRNDKKEGSIRKLFEGRQTSYGNMAKTYFISTPTIKQLSNIEPVYELGDKRKWFWECPYCNEYFTPEWRTELPSGEFAGIVWQLDNNGMLINESVKYKCPHCLELISESKKYDLNIGGKWIPTATPQIENYYSYYINALCCPPGFITWTDMAKEWLEACPPGGQVKKGLLQTFMNVRLGLTWEEQGEAPKVNELMHNTRGYSIGIVPDITSKDDENGDIVLLTLSCDLNGIHNREVKDVRLDWEVKAHSANGQIYSVEHGSIGTFQRKRHINKKDYERDGDRVMYNLDLGTENNVWEEFQRLMSRDWYCESERTMKISLTLVDTGYFTVLAYKFIEEMIANDYDILAVKGVSDKGYTPIKKDTPLFKKGREKSYLYTIDVDRVKDIVAENMKAVYRSDGTQPPGFMNFPTPSDGLYTMKSYFSHFESERRVEDLQNGEVVGFKWEKVSDHVQNHFWDVHIYNVASKELFIDVLRRKYANNKDFKNITWEMYSEAMSD